MLADVQAHSLRMPSTTRRGPTLGGKLDAVQVHEVATEEGGGSRSVSSNIDWTAVRQQRGVIANLQKASRTPLWAGLQHSTVKLPICTTMLPSNLSSRVKADGLLWNFPPKQIISMLANRSLDVT